jgi:UDP-N-acetyl-D-galactosamine dehydrogenase
VTVPTPLDDARRPDLTALLKASATVAHALKPDDIVVYESTVYPGAREEDCIPVLSGLKAGIDFNVGYSPERINPGDQTHRFETIRKVVSAQNERTLNTVAEAYGCVVLAGVHRAPSIKLLRPPPTPRIMRRRGISGFFVAAYCAANAAM